MTSAYRVANLLLRAQFAFTDHNRPLAVALLVAAEQQIPLIEDPLQFLQATQHSNALWRVYLLETELLDTSTQSDALLAEGEMVQ